MAKFCDVIGYGETAEIPPGSGKYKDVITERKAYGDILRNTRQSTENPERVNNDLTVSNSISILADAYANTHFFAIRYVKWAGTLWTVSDVEVQRPRLLLRLGGRYNGPTPN